MKSNLSMFHETVSAEEIFKYLTLYHSFNSIHLKPKIQNDKLEWELENICKKFAKDNEFILISGN